MEDKKGLEVVSIRIFYQVTKKGRMPDLNLTKWKNKLTKKDLINKKKKQFWIIIETIFLDGSGTISRPEEISGEIILCDLED